MLRALRHPLRAFVMGTAALCFVIDMALTSGIVAAVVGAVVGVFVGEMLAGSKLRLSWILALLSSTAGIALAIAALLIRTESLVTMFSLAGALRIVGFLHYGGIAFFATAMMRATAKRHPAWLSLELCFVVLAVAAAFAAHRHGVIARPLWLSDFAWRRGLDPADALMAIGVAAALASVSLLVFERKGRLSLAALQLLPLIAMIAVSFLEVRGADADRGDASPDAMEAQGDPPQEDPEHDDHGQGGGGSDGGVPDAGSSSRQDGGTRGGSDGGTRDGGGSSGSDGGARDGGGGSGSDGGARDGGGASGGGDGGSDGGGGASSSSDGGSSGGFEGWDAGLDDSERPPPQINEGGGGGGQSVPRHAEDMLETPPPTGEAAAAPVAVVLFENDYSPPSESYYFREDAWSEFNGSRLVPSLMEGADRDIAPRFPAGRLNVEAPPEDGRTAVAATVALMIEHPRPFAVESPVYYADARNPNPARFRRAYRFMSRSQSAPYADLLGHRAGNPAWTPEVRAMYLEPHTDPRFSEYAMEIVNAMPPRRRNDPFARAVAIKLRLDQELTYSTRERHADAPDPTVDFFFGNRIGYCVHFAHAAVYLYRAAGVPARVGVGYASQEANRRGGSALLIKSGDAHAWPEIYLEGVGWIVLDIAAHENLDPPGLPQDEDLQRLLGEMAREQPPDPEDEVRPRATRMPSARTIGMTLFWLFLLVLGAILLALYATKLWRRLAPGFAGKVQLPRVAFRAALDRLAEVGASREFGETREQFAARVAALSPSFERATALAMAARLGAPAAVEAREEHDPRRWKEISKAVRLELRRNTKWWRRIIGLLHPAAFFDAR